jgi:hypothetical protein
LGIGTQNRKKSRFLLRLQDAWLHEPLSASSLRWEVAGMVWKKKVLEEKSG